MVTCIHRLCALALYLSLDQRLCNTLLLHATVVQIVLCCYFRLDKCVDDDFKLCTNLFTCIVHLVKVLH